MKLTHTPLYLPTLALFLSLDPIHPIQELPLQGAFISLHFQYRLRSFLIRGSHLIVRLVRVILFDELDLFKDLGVLFLLFEQRLYLPSDKPPLRLEVSDLQELHQLLIPELLVFADRIHELLQKFDVFVHDVGKLDIFPFVEDLLAQFGRVLPLEGHLVVVGESMELLQSLLQLEERLVP